MNAAIPTFLVIFLMLSGCTEAPKIFTVIKDNSEDLELICPSLCMEKYQQEADPGFYAADAHDCHCRAIPNSALIWSMVLQNLGPNDSRRWIEQVTNL